MASEWREVKLGEVVSINTDSIGNDWPFSHIKYIDISSVGEGAIIEPAQILSLDEAPSRAKRLVKEGDSVLSTVRPGRRSMFFAKQPEPDWVVSTGFAVLRARREFIEPRYLYACIFDKAFTEFLVKREKGAAYPAVLPEDIADAVIKLPPLPEQRAIAHILGTLDDKIELNRRMSETLEQMARALFKAWFVDFEPVRAKMEGRWKKAHPLPLGEDRWKTTHPLPLGEGRGEGVIPPDLLSFARELRRNATDAERLLWRLLRNRSLAGAKFRRQHPIPPYVLDFYCPELKLAIELDGGQHNEPKYRQRDTQRTARLEERHGIRVLRFWNREVLHETEAVLQVIYQAVMERRVELQPSPPTPLPVGEGSFLPAHLFDLFPDRLVPSELGEIPEGWEVGRLSDLCSTQYGYTASAVDEPVGPKFLRVTDINKRNWIDWGDVPHCEIDSDAKQAYALKIGDLVVARMADPGKSAIIEDEIDAVFASYLVRLKTRSLAHSYYVYGFLKSDLYAEYAEGAKSGSVQANMNAKVIVGASLVVPPMAVMEEFLKAILPLRQRLVSNVRESRTLAALRDALLPKLISGELRVKDAQRFLKERGL